MEEKHRCVNALCIGDNILWGCLRRSNDVGGEACSAGEMCKGREEM